MRSAQLAILPASEGRRAERRVVNLAARLREPGASVVGAVVHNLSTDGFMAETELKLEMGAEVWLRLPGLEAQKSSVVWIEENKAGFKFAAPLHPATLETLTVASRKPAVKRHFGPQYQAR